MFAQIKRHVVVIIQCYSSEKVTLKQPKIEGTILSLSIFYCNLVIHFFDLFQSKLQLRSSSWKYPTQLSPRLKI